jgi:hypothetical protein
MSLNLEVVTINSSDLKFWRTFNDLPKSTKIKSLRTFFKTHSIKSLIPLILEFDGKDLNHHTYQIHCKSGHDDQQYFPFNLEICKIATEYCESKFLMMLQEESKCHLIVLILPFSWRETKVCEASSIDCNGLGCDQLTLNEYCVSCYPALEARGRGIKERDEHMKYHIYRKNNLIEKELSVEMFIEKILECGKYNNTSSTPVAIQLFENVLCIETEICETKQFDPAICEYIQNRLKRLQDEIDSELGAILSLFDKLDINIQTRTLSGIVEFINTKKSLPESSKAK